MITKRRSPKRYASALMVIALAGPGCSESYRSTMVQNPVPTIEAVLIVSDLTPPVGGSLVVSVQAIATTGTIGSYTARINYDSTALRFDAEAQMNDQALRATNPAPGRLRFAGASSTGFKDGRLASYKFVVLRANAAKTLSLRIDEIHMVTRVDASSNLTVAPARMTSR
jgi:cohesin domain-containing protein